LLAYQTAYLKTHFPVEFMAALLTSETGNAEKQVKYINEARGMSIPILPPDVNESDLFFTPVGDSIRFGLAAIKNVGENTAKAIRDSRLQQGEFKSLYDFCERIESRFLNKRVFESLIKCGAMDSLGPRESMLASVDDAIAAIQRAARAKESGQHGLFFGGGTASEPKVHFGLRDAAPWTEEERLASEYAMLGFYVSGHPLEKYASQLKNMGAISLGEVEGQRNGKEITVAGLIVGTRPMRSRKGARWAIFTLQDMTGVQELLAFPESFARLEIVLKPGQPLLLKARIQVEEAGTRLSLQEARPLQTVAETNGPAEYRVKLDLQRLNEAALAQLEELFAKAAGPSTVVFEVKANDGTTAVVQSQRKIRVTPDFIAALDRICGDEGIQRVS
jgi:DNA polymerase-3 subunit alpha